jgi:hypothetical protein
MYYRQRITQNSFPNFLYIFSKSFMIFQLEAAASLWRNLIPNGPKFAVRKTEKERRLADGRGREGEESKQESLVLYESFDTLW